MAVSSMALLGTAAVVAFLMLNRMVDSTRVADSAQAIAQTQIDRIMCQPYAAQGTRPVELTPGTTIIPSVPIYIDPVAGAVLVSGSVTTTIADVSRVIVTNNPAPPLLQANVVVNYWYRGRPGSVTLTTVRTVD